MAAPVVLCLTGRAFCVQSFTTLSQTGQTRQHQYHEIAVSTKRQYRVVASPAQ
jgi:hypothetical protein